MLTQFVRNGRWIYSKPHPNVFIFYLFQLLDYDHAGAPLSSVFSRTNWPHNVFLKFGTYWYRIIFAELPSYGEINQLTSVVELWWSKHITATTHTQTMGFFQFPFTSLPLTSRFWSPVAIEKDTCRRCRVVGLKPRPDCWEASFLTIQKHWIMLPHILFIRDFFK